MCFYSIQKDDFDIPKCLKKAKNVVNIKLDQKRFIIDFIGTSNGLKIIVCKCENYRIYYRN